MIAISILNYQKTFKIRAPAELYRLQLTLLCLPCLQCCLPWPCSCLFFFLKRFCLLALSFSRHIVHYFCCKEICKEICCKINYNGRSSQKNLCKVDLAKLPFFNGDKTHTFMCKQWIARVQRWKDFSGWDNNKTMMYVPKILSWSDFAYTRSINCSSKVGIKNLDSFKVGLLNAFLVIGTSHTTTINRTSLVQGANEWVSNYYIRVVDTIKDIESLKKTQPTMSFCFPVGGSCQHPTIHGPGCYCLRRHPPQPCWIWNSGLSQPLFFWPLAASLQRSYLTGPKISCWCIRDSCPIWKNQLPSSQSARCHHHTHDARGPNRRLTTRGQIQSQSPRCPGRHQGQQQIPCCGCQAQAHQILWQQWHLFFQSIVHKQLEQAHIGIEKAKPRQECEVPLL